MCCLCACDKSAGSANSDRPARPAPSPSPVNQSTRPMTQGAKPTTKLQKPGQSSSPRPHLHALQVHPGQPTPSPSQLNNPGIYAAPPPSRPSRPTSSQGPFKFPEPQVPGGRSSSPIFMQGKHPAFLLQIGQDQCRRHPLHHSNFPPPMTI